MTNKTEAPELLPCPSCRGDAELDTMQAFAKFQSSGGGIGNAVAVYCLKCNFTCSFCHDDFDGGLDELIHLVVENWNTRADLSDDKDARIAELEAMQEVLMRGGKALQARAEAAEEKLAHYGVQWQNVMRAQAARIAELEAERDETMREALPLARSLHKTHYSDVTQWEPLDYPAGIISQIDNMVAGIGARAKAAEAKLTDCNPYLKDHETPAQRLESNHKDALSLMKLLEQEKRHSEVWVKAARVAEAKLAKAFTAFRVNAVRFGMSDYEAANLIAELTTNPTERETP